MFLSKDFFTPSNHVVIVEVFFVWSSCWRIDSLTSFSGVCFAGFTAESAWMMCQPYVVCTGGDVWPVLSENATLSNGATVWPFVIVSLPPFGAEPGSFEYFFASVAKLAPEFSCASMLSASFLLFTRMWRMSRLSCWVYVDLLSL